jgi:hypothetical protein
VERFIADHGDGVSIDQFELRLPDDPGELDRAVEVASDQLATGAMSATVFFEASLLDGWRQRLPAAVAAIADPSRSGRPAGMKIRCGGLEPQAVPSTVAVAAAVSACRQVERPLKATQGLHHPLRHFDVGLETTTHGFLNLFAAAVFAAEMPLARERLLGVIEEERAGAFVFGEDGVSWGDMRADVERIAAARRRAITSFGSCSFSEVRDGLQQIGLIGAQAASRSEDREPATRGGNRQ